MTTNLYRELFDLCVAGAVAQSRFHADDILNRPGELMRELMRTLSPIEADKLIDAIEETNQNNDRARAEREAAEIVLEPCEAGR